MPAPPLSHPDRLATTLANLDAARAERPTGPFAPPGEGAADCRIDLKLLRYRAERALQRSEAARAHLRPFDAAEHPDLWAGTVRDGVARGFAARLEEAASLAPDHEESARDDDAPADAPADALADGGQTFTGKELRRKKDILVASGGARARFSRKGGVLFVDRGDDVHSENCLWFEARRDHGSLDAFAGDDDERARLFSAQFLKPLRYSRTDAGGELVLAGRLGRGPVGWGCRVTLRGAEHRPTLRLDVELRDCPPGWRLRARFLGVPATHVEHRCTPVREVVDGPRGGFVADTLVRACARLDVDGAPVDVPGAASPGPLRHTFLLGNRER